MLANYIYLWGEQRVYIDNTKSFLQLPNLRKAFREWAYNEGVPLPFTLRIPIDSGFRTLLPMYVNTYILAEATSRPRRLQMGRLYLEA